MHRGPPPFRSLALSLLLCLAGLATTAGCATRTRPAPALRMTVHGENRIELAGETFTLRALPRRLRRAGATSHTRLELVVPRAGSERAAQRVANHLIEEGFPKTLFLRQRPPQWVEDESRPRQESKKTSPPAAQPQPGYWR